MPADLSTGQIQQLSESAERLHRDFEGVFSRETIQRLMEDSLDRLMARATYTTFVPLLAERFAAERLRSLGRNEGVMPTDSPTVLFLCVQNAGRSQMAAGWMQHLAGGRVEVLSGGSAPGPDVNPSAVEAMKEVGIDITSQFPKPWTDETIGAADVVVTMGCGDACPVLPGKRYLDWELQDPANLDIEQVRPIRDEIERRVRDLLGELGVEAAH